MAQANQFNLAIALIAAQPNANQAADAAVAFGQDDDITVLTITRGVQFI